MVHTLNIELVVSDGNEEVTTDKICVMYLVEGVSWTVDTVLYAVT